MDIKAGDVVVCVDAEFSVCPYHNLDRFAGDPHPHMVGKHYTIERQVGRWEIVQPSANCVGWVELGEIPGRVWCVGCFRKVEKASAEFASEIRALNPHRELERQA